MNVDGHVNDHSQRGVEEAVTACNWLSCKDICGGEILWKYQVDLPEVAQDFLCLLQEPFTSTNRARIISSRLLDCPHAPAYDLARNKNLKV